MYNRNLVLRLLNSSVATGGDFVGYFTRIGLSDYWPPNGNKEVYGFSASYATRQNGASALKIAIVWGIVMLLQP